MVLTTDIHKAKTIHLEYDLPNRTESNAELRNIVQTYFMVITKLIDKQRRI